MRFWPACFGGVTVVIVGTMMIPQVFGLQHFTQWGGMYVNSHCDVLFASADVEDGKTPGPGTRVIPTESLRRPNVYYLPVDNAATCMAWARSRCRQKLGQWRIVSAYPSMHGAFLTETPQNVCDFPPDASVQWFSTP